MRPVFPHRFNWIPCYTFAGHKLNRDPQGIAYGKSNDTIVYVSQIVSLWLETFYRHGFSFQQTHIMLCDIQAIFYLINFHPVIDQLPFHTFALLLKL